MQAADDVFDEDTRVIPLISNKMFQNSDVCVGLHTQLADRAGVSVCVSEFTYLKSSLEANHIPF